MELPYLAHIVGLSLLPTESWLNSETLTHVQGAARDISFQPSAAGEKAETGPQVSLLAITSS